MRARRSIIARSSLNAERCVGYYTHAYRMLTANFDETVFSDVVTEGENFQVESVGHVTTATATLTTLDVLRTRERKSRPRRMTDASESVSSAVQVAFALLQLLIFVVCIGAASRFSERRQRQQAAADQMNAAKRRCLGVDEGNEDSEQLGLVEVAADDDADDRQTVRRELAKLRLGCYTDAFLEHGYDYWPEILRLPSDRLAILVHVTGMSINHAHRFREQLVAQRLATGIQQMGPAISPVLIPGDGCKIL